MRELREWAAFLPAPDLLCWLTWGSAGSGDERFDRPIGVAVGGSGGFFVADLENHRIVRAQPL